MFWVGSRVQAAISFCAWTGEVRAIRTAARSDRGSLQIESKVAPGRIGANTPDFSKTPQHLLEIETVLGEWVSSALPVADAAQHVLGKGPVMNEWEQFERHRFNNLFNPL